METIQFEVQGSAAKPYTVQFIRRSEHNISAYCTCPAGQRGQYCKHRFNIISNNAKSVVSKNIDQVEVVVSWIPGSDIEKAMIKAKKAEEAVEKAKKALAAAKKEIALTMRD